MAKLPRRALVPLGAALALVAAGGMYFAYQALRDDRAQPEETYLIAPDFSLPNGEGALVSLSEVPGSVRVVNFWASWSPYSKDELQSFVKLKEKFGNDIAVIALDRDTNLSDGRAFIASLGLSNELTFVFDQEDGYFKEVQGFAVPETLFLDREGNIRNHVHGPMTYEEMETAVRGILEE